MIPFISGLDASVLQYLYTERGIATSLSFIGITELGSTVFVCGLTLCIGIFLVFRRQIPYAAGLAISVFGGEAAALLIKDFLHRARPEKIYQAYAETGFSFPSGHATLAAAFYGFLMFLLWRMMPAGYLRTAAILALTLLIGLIAFSRLYLGVHYLSDVLGGLLLGAAFAYLGTALVRKIERRG
ncbi:phosphatase PAP2 family protein [Candidatus Kaiserbacteria bacterium]|nr:phosphatase PAP2 family protein [Candidatus Kaiserbacteria bacterium]